MFISPRGFGLELSVGQMATSLRFEDRLEGASNFIPWKERIALLLKENELWDLVKDTQSIPTDATQLDAYNNKKREGQKDSKYLSLLLIYIVANILFRYLFLIRNNSQIVHP